MKDITYDPDFIKWFKEYSPNLKGSDKSYFTIEGFRKLHQIYTDGVVSLYYILKKQK